MKLATTLIALAACAFLTAPATADWMPGDGHKMHFPQLPDPNGWDIEISSFTNQHEVADDWQCSLTGAVTDIHFWYSVAGDRGEGEPTQIDRVVATIYEDDRSGEFSKPGPAVWGPTTFDAASGGFSVVEPYGTGDQGFADPQQPVWTPNDHTLYHQINIENIDNPFVQQEGGIYWLGLYVNWDAIAQEPVGWKTADTNQYPPPNTGMHFEDDAVYRELNTGNWLELTDPFTGASLDMAFVITGIPEPPTLMLLVLGFTGILVSKRKLS